MQKIGILYICTGVYKVLWPEFYLSAEKNLLPDMEKHYYVFTDAEEVEFEHENPRIHRTKQEAYQWPFGTLLRFSIFLQREENIKECDYLFFFNADAEFVKPITEDMILPRKELGEDIVVVRHAGQYDKSPEEFTYDRNPDSLAYIPQGAGKIYVCGGVNGGTSEAYLRMCHTLADRIQDDLNRNVIALWHDESHLNKYILEYDHYRLLTPSFTYPGQEWWNIPFEPAIVIRDKTKYFDVNKVKGIVDEDNRSFLRKVYDKCLWIAASIKTAVFGKHD